jgi:hypothetical protein
MTSERVPLARAPISIVMPIRNEARNLGAIATNLAATLSHEDEIVVVDNGSTDASEVLVRKWAKRDPRVVYLQSGGGLASALNHGVAHATFELIARVDADDVSHPERFDLQARALEGVNAAVFCDYVAVTGSRRLGLVPSAIFPPFVAISLTHPFRTPHGGSAFSRPAWREAGGYSDGEVPAEDLGLWLRMSRVGALVSIPRPLIHYRHPRSHHGRATLRQREMMAARVKASSPLPPQVIQEASARWSEYRLAVSRFPAHRQRLGLAAWDLWSSIRRSGYKSMQLDLPGVGRPPLAQDMAFGLPLAFFMSTWRRTAATLNRVWDAESRTLDVSVASK